MSALSVNYVGSADAGPRLSRLAQLFHSIIDARGRGDLAQALRAADAARRISPADTAVDLVYARLLIQTGNAAQAESLLRSSDHPGAVATRAEALLQLGRAAEAASLCADLLAHYAVDCVDGLERVLAELCRGAPLPRDRARDRARNLQRPEASYAGWVGVEASGAIVGIVRAGSTISWQSGDRIRLVRLQGKPSGIAAFREPIAAGTVSPLHLHCSAGPLLGSPLRWPPQFAYSGWVVREHDELHGEVHPAWAPGRPVTLVVSAQGQPERRLALSPGTKSTHYSFTVTIPPGVEAPIAVGVALPDGTVTPLLGSPVRRIDAQAAAPVAMSPPPLQLLQRPEPAQARAEKTAETASAAAIANLGSMAAPAAPGAAAPVDIIIPVYAGREETLCCIESVLATVSASQGDVVVVNDASPDQTLAVELARLAETGRITLLVNTENQGFAASVNSGLQLHPDRDAVLLNADCEVYPDWLARLRAAAVSSLDIGSVTPLGEAASIASYPAAAHAAALTPEAALKVDEIARQVNAGRLVDVPVGVGFCLYLRRACLREVGSFDALTYGRGYGEENDFCLRARRRGWRHVVAGNVFVRHSGGRSFGAQRHLLMARNGRVLNALHPGYDALVAEYLARDPLHAARRAIDIERMLSAAIDPVLLISHDKGGGVQRIVDGRIAHWRRGGHSVLLLQSNEDGAVRLTLSGPDSAGHEPEVPEFGTDGHRTQEPGGLELPNLVFRAPQEMAELERVLERAKLSAMELHHFLDLPETLLDWVAAQDVPLTAYLHDYSWICPRITLLGGDGRYCGEPRKLADCESCASTHGSAFPALTVAQLRERSARLLTRAKDVLCGANDVRTRYARYFPGLPITVTRWESERPVQIQSQAKAADAPLIRTAAQGRVRVAVFGAISIQKGHQVIVECARAAAAADLPLEFVLIGYSCDDAALLETGRVFITGPYREEELPELARREACHVAWFASVTPETWCFALDHAIALGLPIVAFNIGAQAERLCATVHSEVRSVPPQLEPPAAPSTPPSALLALDTPIARINERLIEMANGNFGAASLAPKQFEGLAPPTTVARNSLESEPQDHGKNVNAIVSPAEPTDAASPAVPETEIAPQPPPALAAEQSASVQMINLPDGVYSFSIASGAPQGEHGPNMALPSLHVGLAPVQSSAQVEFFAGPGTLDRWLAFASDRVIVRVSSEREDETAGLLLTSLREDHHPALSINIARIDVPLAAEPGAPEPLRIMAHVRQLGDLYFDAGQVGPVGSDLWLEAFIVEGAGADGAELLEYRAVNVDGFETPWLSDGVLCGSRGRGTPLLGFAVRPRVAYAATHECSYVGHFASGKQVGPITDGSLCRSEDADDPLLGMELRVTVRE